MPKKTKNSTDFNDLLSKDPKVILEKWSYDNNYSDVYDKKKVFSDTNNSKLDFNSKLYEIALWKINRRIVVNNLTESELKELIKKKKIKEAINKLTSSENKGIGLPMASTILHFYSNGKYPIIDQRSYRVINKKEPEYGKSRKMSLGEIYEEYYSDCINFIKDNDLEKRGLDPKDVDKYTYQIDIERRNRNN